MNISNPSLFKQQAFINGQWVDATDHQTMPIYNPSSNQLIGRVPVITAQQTQEAIRCAQAAWANWRDKPAKERSTVLRRWFDLILENQEDLATIITLEQGKPLNEARGEIIYGSTFVEWFAEEAKRVYGDTIPAPSADKKIIVIKQAIGVVAAITPWNFPNAMITRKCAPALAAGCPVIVKPAPETPFSALALAELGQQAGLPDGILNVITGDAQIIGAELTASPIVRKLSFTGSTKVGKILMRQCADTVKKLSLELGGNAPFIVFDDADLDAAVEGAMASKFRNTGQTCVCANRILVQDGIYDAFAEKLARTVAKMVVADGLSEQAEQGPLINSAALAKVQTHLDNAVELGATVLTGGQPHALGGLFFQPTVLSNVNETMQISHEETFGPIAPLYRFNTDQEAIDMANNTPFGLAAYFYSQNIKRVWHIAEALEVGIVGINAGVVSSEVAPFGGIKESGIGREGSKYGIDEFVEMKYLCLGEM
ncbi:MAG: NAD-dependent succinate-semialdehyde dehydrogenase [Cycloclasticus sp.]|jgi:succinate-semialdehyde dehydrogenase/glutarate-semialdehyde dehydrogenase|nr:MAG: NAD-dependent succinate-semialdehyde dehydrogenase [Cycloclasticus sp. Phe_18]MDF1689503.1 NAD-dependent succinate-semialdehyde dehydrogenase [Cycloclasticus sp.]MEE4290520.1 NAD-dependent succinate-semialdehyde dehydrogenase [Cycloclasticus sp.]